MIGTPEERKQMTADLLAVGVVADDPQIDLALILAGEADA